MKIIDKISLKISRVISNIDYWKKVFIVYLTQNKKFEIKRGYIHKIEYSYFNDTTNTDNWQLEVYLRAKEFAVKLNTSTMVDYGCGSGFKLIKYFPEYNTVGLDVSPTVDFLLEKYPNKKWYNIKDFEKLELDSEIVICADVIEHVLNPEELLNNIKKIKNIKYLFVSTPDRNLLPKAKYGPPINQTHIREWSFEEFNKYISKHFFIEEHYISNPSQQTQLIIAQIK